LEELRKRLAIVGGGAHTIPTYRALLKSFAEKYQIFLISEFYIDPKEHAKEYIIYSVSSQIKNRRWRELQFGLLVLKVCFKNRVSLIHSHSTYPSGFASVVTGSILRLPVVVSLDAAEATGISDIGFGDLLHPKRRRVNQWVMNRATMLTVLTEFQRKEVQGNLNLRREMCVIPRGINAQSIREQKRLLKSKPIQFLNVAYIHPVKDHNTLLKTFKTISQEIDSRLTLVGKDYESTRIQKLAKTLGIEHLVNFVGFVPHENMQLYFNNADILLHTSRYESQALVVVEAMASGVLVCGTHVGLMADLSGQCCITASIQDDSSLAQQVIDLIHDEQRQHQLRSAGLMWTQVHSLTWTTQQYFFLYDQLLGDSQPGENR